MQYKREVVKKFVLINKIIKFNINNNKIINSKKKYEVLI